MAALARQAKRSALLAYLAAAVPRGLHRRDTLLALFWPESDTPHARAALNQALYVLRTELGDDTIVTDGDDQVGLRGDAVWCDAAAFEAALDAGRPHDALELYRGDLLEGFFVSGAPEFERWLERARARLRERAAQGAWALADAKAAAGEPVDAARWARRGSSLAPADEAMARRLMTFLSGLGDRAAAVRAYDEFAASLKRDYDLAPSAGTQALAATIRAEEHQVPATSSARAAVAPIPGSGKRRSGLVAALVAVVLVGALGLTVVTRRGAETAPSAVRPRILVLPFQNLGGARDAYLSDGITDEITARLATVKGLQVVGGRSALRYQGTAKTPRQMREEIGVDYVLVGTVTWERNAKSPGRVRVRPQLINARDETQVWAAVLDEDMNTTELFAMLSGITRRVVDEVHVALDAPQEAGVSAIPTRNLEAYDYYLRGRVFVRGAWSERNNRAAIEMLTRAVARDTTFALAYAWLSIAHANAQWLHAQGAAHLALAKTAADRALKFDPRLPDVQRALGFYYYACCQDYRRALVHFERSRAARPGDAQLIMFIGNAHKRAGQWIDAMRDYEEAASLDPAWHAPLLNLSQAQLWLHRYVDAEATARRALALEPRDAFAYTMWASVPLLRDGDLEATGRVVREAATVSDGYDGMRTPFYSELVSRHYAAALTHLGDRLGPLESGDDFLVSDEIRRAVTFRLLGDSAAARAHFESGRLELEGRLAAFAHSPQMLGWLESGLAICYAGLGRRDAARERARRVLVADPVAVDAISGPAALQDLALTYVLLGDRTAALDVLERLLSVPARFSPQLLRLDPLWDPLRGDARFERLASKRS
jgi:TolB-like protein/DNA-binding SARP family transcriptional activator/Flp pilus assembly protein TadD